MNTDELREKYLQFFETKYHRRIASDVLVPTWDPSVLFTPAGMNQFKDHFLGNVELEYTRATTCQKCLRTGDIDNVGRTAYHHTFFEMLGNFSFGDYFKRDAIHWAWEFLTEKKWLGIHPDRLTVTVFDDDDEAFEIWQNDIGLSSSKIEREDEHENFWPAGAPSNGPDGVCGPCSEIFYHDDFGDTVEIWNLVFTQFNRVGDPPDNLKPLPSKNIDTGMGLERTAASLQGVETNYHIDIIRPIVLAAAEVCGIDYEPNSENGRRLRRITDHVRACTFAIHENVLPDKNKEQYVVRRLLRRAVLDGHQLGQREPFLNQLVPAVVQTMQHPYPELKLTASNVASVIQREEKSFFETIGGGLDHVKRIFQRLKQQRQSSIDGDAAAELYTTYGLPPELVESLAAEHNFDFDWDGFRAAMTRHGEISGTGRGELFKSGPVEALKRALHATEFLGYETTEAACTIKGIVAQDRLCDQLDEVDDQQPVIVVLDRSPFYGESGGQVGDSGEIVGRELRFEVNDTQKDSDLILHIGHLRQGVMVAGQDVTAKVDVRRRQAIRRAHSATHIVHYALQQNLGEHAQQRGSKVTDDWLRFDFAHQEAVPDRQLQEIEQLTNRRIADAQAIAADIVPLAEAKAQGAMMLFGEKYPDPVRMVSMGDFSKELCGGTHLTNTSEVGQLEIISEEAVAAGTRRIVALTGEKARQNALQNTETLRKLAEMLNCSLAQVPQEIERLMRRAKELKKQLASNRQFTGENDRPPASDSRSDLNYQEMRMLLRIASRQLNVTAQEAVARVESLLSEIQDLEQQISAMAQSDVIDADMLLDRASMIGDIHLIVAEVPGASPNMMRNWIDQIRKKAQPSAVFLASIQGADKVLLVAGFSKDLVDRGFSAGQWVKEVAPAVGGGGGGKPDMAQAGGRQPENIGVALDAAREFMRSSTVT